MWIPELVPVCFVDLDEYMLTVAGHDCSLDLLVDRETFDRYEVGDTIELHNVRLRDLGECAQEGGPR